HYQRSSNARGPEKSVAAEIPREENFIRKPKVARHGLEPGPFGSVANDRHAKPKSFLLENPGRLEQKRNPFLVYQTPDVGEGREVRGRTVARVTGVGHSMVHNFATREGNALRHVPRNGDVGRNLRAHPAAREGRQHFDHRLPPSSGCVDASQAHAVAALHKVPRTHRLVRLLEEEPVWTDSLVSMMLHCYGP